MTGVVHLFCGQLFHENYMQLESEDKGKETNIVQL